jgi:plastocyanin
MKPGINMTLGSLVMLVVFGISAVLLYGGAKLVDTDTVAAVEDDGGDVTPGGPVNVRVVGQNLLFSPRTVNASVGVPVTVNFDNQDAGVLHNIAFYTNRQATTPIKVGEIFPGVAARETTFTAPTAPGAYFFRCDVHPDTMTGTFNVR